MKKNISHMKYSFPVNDLCVFLLRAVLINAVGQDACADVCKKDCRKTADSSEVVQSSINIACLQTPLPTAGAFSDSVVEIKGMTMTHRQTLTTSNLDGL